MGQAGPGAEERWSIAVLTIGGQTLSLLLTLLAVPVLYSLFDELGQLLQVWMPTAKSHGRVLEAKSPTAAG